MISYVEVNESNKFYKCGSGPNGYVTTADVPIEDLPYKRSGSGTWEFNQSPRGDEYNIFLFEVTDGELTVIRGQCLP